MLENGSSITMTKLIPVYIHIEKAAGTTVHNMLIRNNPFHYLVTPSGHLDDQSKSGRPLLASELREILNRLWFTPSIGGHNIVGYENYTAPANSEFLYFTMLRDPIERYISHFEYQNRIMNRGLSLEAFLEDETFSNVMCKKLTKRGMYINALEQIKEKNIIIGLTEFMDVFLDKLKAEIYSRDNNFFLNTSHTTMNINTKKPIDRSYRETLPDHILQKVIDKNLEDIMLYDHFEANQYQQAALFDDSYNEIRKQTSFRRNEVLSKIYLRCVVRPLERRIRQSVY